jgi:Flp pilus assembly protein TadD
MAHSDRLERQQVRQIVREAEGYLDLIMSLADHWPLRADVRDQVAQRAVAALSRLNDAGSDQAKVLHLLGQAYRVMERYDLAVRPLEQSAEIDPTNIHTHLALGWCYKRTGRLDLAIEALQAALAAEPDEAIVYYNLACYWSLAKNKQNALDCLSRALSMDGQYREMVHHESDFDNLRDDPDFQTLAALIV